MTIPAEAVEGGWDEIGVVVRVVGITSVAHYEVESSLGGKRLMMGVHIRISRPGT